jgi:hypothetical protein
MAAMGWLALLFAALAAGALALPAPGLFAAMGLSIFALAAGVVGYRRQHDSSSARMAGAGAIAIAVVALGLSALEYGLTLAAVGKLTAMFS